MLLPISPFLFRADETLSVSIGDKVFWARAHNDPEFGLIAVLQSRAPIPPARAALHFPPRACRG